MICGDSLQELIAEATILDADKIAQFGCTVLIAPHPDDESLACGGLISLLATGANKVYIIFITDGSMSHPASKKYPPAALAKLREEEALDAASVLHISPSNVFFLRGKDAQLPQEGTAEFNKIAATLSAILDDLCPRTMILPWRRDPHADHRASWHIAYAAIRTKEVLPGIIEYPLWLWERGTGNDLPQKNEVTALRIDIDTVLQRKLLAINAHRSQVSNLIDDDANGFMLSPEVLKHFNTTFELYFQVNNNFKYG